MNEYIKRIKEVERNNMLLTRYLNAMADDNVIVYDVDYNERLGKHYDSDMVAIKYTTEFVVTRDEFDKLIETIDTWNMVSFVFIF